MTQGPRQNHFVDPPRFLPTHKLKENPTDPRPIPMSQALLQENPDRFVLFPISHREIWRMYKLQVSNFWTPEEIDLSRDRADWLKLADEERHFLTMVLAFFAASDGIVSENLVTNFCREIQVPEARCFYAFQHAMENIHSETYANLLVEYVRDLDERDRVLRAVQTVPSIRQKAEWAMRYMDPSCPFAQRIVAFAVVEGIFFSGSFCAIFWMKSRGLLPGLCFSNELISRDESLHCEFACHLFSMCRPDERPARALIVEMMHDAVACEKAFIDESLPQGLVGMNAAAMSMYIEYVADRLLGQLGYEPIWKSHNPFRFMNLSNIDGKTNFFERNVSEYRRATMADEVLNGGARESSAVVDEEHWFDHPDV